MIMPHQWRIIASKEDALCTVESKLSGFDEILRDGNIDAQYPFTLRQCVR